MRIAVIGAGISGLGCAYALTRSLAQQQAQITVYEAEPRLGGHANTIDAAVDGITYPVDTGFLVYNERTYPNLIRLFDELAVPVAKSDMSFAVSLSHGASSGQRLEWAGSNLDTVFAQRRNLASPRFWSMLKDIVRFNRAATAAATENTPLSTHLSLGDYLEREGYGAPFRQWYLLPMAAAIWSCPVSTMMAYPFATFARFYHNHGLLQIFNRPQWFTVHGGARQYVQKIAALLPDVRINEPVSSVRPLPTGKVEVKSRSGTTLFDEVVFASHSDQTLRMLAQPQAQEEQVLRAVAYQPNRAILHTDTRLLPQSRKVWSSWNYASDSSRDDDNPAVCVTYLLNMLQPLPFKSPVMVSLNPSIEPRAEHVLAEIDYMHPIFDAAAINAQQRLAHIQGQRGLWFAGAWTGYGFHEDGLKSGLAVAEALHARIAHDRLAA